MSKHTLDIALVLCYNLAMIAGTAYLVEFHNWSGWWFMVTLCFVITKLNTDD